MQFQRHDLVEFKPAYLSHIVKCAVDGLLPCCRTTEVEQKVGSFLRNSLPGIVCRPVTDVAADQLQLGLSFPFRERGVRVRSSIVADRKEIARVTCPYKVVARPGLSSSTLQNTLDRIVVLANIRGLKIGLIGSAALEIFTGHAYTRASSDLDLIVEATPHDTLLHFYMALSKISEEHERAVDVEVILPDGNGVKLGELVGQSRKVLAKSLTEVCLLNRDSILRTLVEPTE